MNRTQLRILLIEDNPADVALIREYLRDCPETDFDFHAVDRLSEADLALRQSVIDLILIDLGLPDAQGMESFRAIRDLAPTMPIVVLSGLHDDALALGAVREGAQDYIAKSGLSGPLLTRTLRYALERHRSENTLRVIAQAVSATTGEQFFHSLVEQLSEALQVDYVFLSELASSHSPDNSTLSAWGPRGAIANFTWKSAGEPAELVAQGHVVSLPADVGELFPNARLVKEFSAKSYLGVPLFDGDSRVSGLLEVASTSPLPNTSVVESTLRIFAARAGAELARVRAADAVAEWKTRYEAAIRASGQLLYDWDAVSDRIIWGGNAEETLGYSLDGLSTSIDWMDIVHPDDRDAYHAELTRSLAVRSAFQLEYRVRHSQGHYVHMEDTGHFCRDSRGGMDRMIGFIADVTERKRMEDQLRHSQKMDAIGQLAGGLAHDFRNLLMAINGHLSLAKAALVKDHPIHESLEQIAEAAHQAGGITNALLTFAHKSPTLKQPVRLTSIVEQSARLFRRTLPSNILLDIRAGADDSWVSADATQIQQAVMNLAINAADAMPRGGTLALHVDELPPNTDLLQVVHTRAVRLTVSDTGIGMSPEVRSRIFEPYFTTKPRGQGTGLGLSITHSILKDHAGSISAQSTPGQGTTFTILLPAIDPPSRRGDSTIVQVSRIGSGKSALVAGNHTLVRSVVASMLVSAGFAVTQTNAGEPADRCLTERGAHFALLVLDLDNTAFEPARAISQFREKYPDLDIVLITSRADALKQPDPHTALLRKPFQVADLCATLTELAAAQPPNPPPA